MSSANLSFAPQLRCPTRGRVHGNQAFGCHRSGHPQRKLNGSGIATQVLRGQEIPIHGVRARDPHDLVVEQSRAFAGVTQPDATRRPGRPTDDATAQQPLQVDGDVEMPLFERGKEVSETRKLRQ